MSQVANRRAALLAFDADWYLGNYPDVALTGLSPFIHYERYGQLLGRPPCAGWQLASASLAQPAPAVELAFTASHQVKPDPEREHGWISTGIDPYFIFSNSDGFFGASVQPGFFFLTVSVEAERSRRVRVKIYFDYGEGFSEQSSCVVVCKDGETVDRCIYVSSPVRRFRFDPMESTGRFAVLEMRLTSAPRALARFSMLEAISKGSERWLDLSHDDILSEIASLHNGELDSGVFFEYEKLFDSSDVGFDYSKWIDEFECYSLPTKNNIDSFLLDSLCLPVISVVIPAYNTPEKYLRACIDSVLAQSYPHWELCIADDASPQPHVRRVLEEYAAREPRVRLALREQNGHISRASNSALEIATGDYVALLDHDDALPEHALYFVACAIAANPELHIIYSDEDKIDEHDHRSEPHFKSDWNPDLFYAQNYVSHLGVYRRSLLQSIGGFRPGVEGSQDQDLLLRCLPHVPAGGIHHIPRVLYHWRTLPGSTALASGEKSYTTEAGIRALQDHFTANGPAGATVEGGLIPNTYRVRWPIPEPAPLVSLLIPTRDRKAITEVAVRSILEKTTYPNYEILILDNGSVEAETLEFFDQIQHEDARVRVLRYDHPFNYSAINNFGVGQARGEIIGLVNNDVEVISPEWLTEMLSHACRPDIGCVGAKLYYSNDTLQHGGVIVGLGGVAGHSHKHYSRQHPGYFYRLMLPQNLSAVTAACLLVRKSVYEQVGGLDEHNLRVAFNDVDFCLKVREAGYRNLWTPYAELYHHESISRGTEDTPEKQARFAQEVRFMKEKWGEQLKLDPYYSPNLSQTREDFSYASTAKGT